jgi:small subunit ribosomal protein S17
VEGKNQPTKRVLTGQVVSDKMDKTIVVSIRRRKLHRLYKKFVNMTKKVKAHDQGNECKIGDTVRVIECRPLSKDKRWRLLEIVERAK